MKNRKASDEREALAKGVERQALSARAVHEALRLEGESELQRSWRALGWSGLAAGISIGLSLIAEGLLHAHLPDTPWRPLVSSFGYTIGFLAVTLGRQQLFTETTLTACLPLLHEPSRAILRQVLTLWVVVLSANLLGGLLFAWGASLPSAFGPELRASFATLGREAIAHDPTSAFVRGIFGGWIIALMVWLLPAAEAARPFIIVAMTYVIAAADLTHIIAGSVEAFYLIAVGELGWGAYFGWYFVPVFLGNSVGGIVLVAALNHTQAVAGRTDG